MFGCEKIKIVFVRDESNVSRYRWVSLRHVNKTEHAVHFRQSGLSSDGNLESVNYYIPAVYVTVSFGNKPFFGDSQAFDPRDGY